MRTGFCDQEQPYPPDYQINKFVIKFQCDDEGTWSAYCPEWKCELHGISASKAAEGILESIDTHNDDIARADLEAALEEDPNRVLNAFCKLIEEGKLK